MNPKSTAAKTGPKFTRGEFLYSTAAALGSLALFTGPKANAAPPTESAVKVASSGKVYDLRDFVRWILDMYEPSVRLAGGAGRYARSPGQTGTELYGVSDMACILYTLNALKCSAPERAEWAAAFQEFQNPDTGWLIEKKKTHDPLHNTAFALAAMQLLDLTPKFPVRLGAEFSDPRAFLATLDWRKKVYPESHKGAGSATIMTLVPGLGSPKWFAEYFAACDALFDPNNGLMGVEKPAQGDFDQIGGTFHYNFVYQHYHRRLPYPEKRIDTVLRLQLPSGYWSPKNRLWLTLDAIYLMTRTLRYCPYRMDDVCQSIRRALDAVQADFYSPEGRKENFTIELATHALTAAISIAAEAQQFFGAQEIVTELPLKLVLDRRPFI